MAQILTPTYLQLDALTKKVHCHSESLTLPWANNFVLHELLLLRPTSAEANMPISIGSDCSGVGTDAVAMSRLNVDFECVFASESNEHCRDVLD